MYGYEASSFVESMNSGNQAVRARGIDIFHAIKILFRLEQKRYLQNKSEADQRTHLMTAWAQTKFLGRCPSEG